MPHTWSCSPGPRFGEGTHSYRSTSVDGQSALAEFDRAGADIVLLDLMLPGMSGTDVCKQLRSRSSVPVIMVTARDSEIDKGEWLNWRR